MTPTTALGLSMHLFMFDLCETGDCNIFLGLLERARAETCGADQWVLKRRELPGFAIVIEKKTPSVSIPGILTTSSEYPGDNHNQF